MTATSANRSGMSAPSTARELRAQLGDSLDALIDGGRLPDPTGSTVLDLTQDPPTLLRPGPIPFEALHAFLEGNVQSSVA